MLIENIVNTIYEKGYSITQDFVSSKIIDDLLIEFEKQKLNLREANIGKNENKLLAKEIRSDKIVWLERTTELSNLFFSSLDELIIQLNRRCFLGVNDFEFHFACYETGTFYKRHKDAFTNDAARKISVILYLNKSWQASHGGELMIYTKDSEIKVEPKAGTLVVFESILEHEVLLSNATRISLTGWLKRG